MAKSEQYRRFAHECLVLARNAEDGASAGFAAAHGLRCGFVWQKNA